MSAPTTDRGGIQQTIRALRAAGWGLSSVDDGGDELQEVQSELDAIEAIMAVDDAYLYVRQGDQVSWVRFVMGNDPEEVVCDYTMSLDGVISPLYDLWSE